MVSGQATRLVCSCDRVDVVSNWLRQAHCSALLHRHICVISIVWICLWDRYSPKPRAAVKHAMITDPNSLGSRLRYPWFSTRISRVVPVSCHWRGSFIGLSRQEAFQFGVFLTSSVLSDQPRAPSVDSLASIRADPNLLLTNHRLILSRAAGAGCLALRGCRQDAQSLLRESLCFKRFVAPTVANSPTHMTQPRPTRRVCVSLPLWVDA
jgi:hypothetical protein